MKAGDKVRFKKNVDVIDLQHLDIEDPKCREEIYILKWKEPGYYSKNDWRIMNDHRNYIAPIEWLEIVEEGHPYTKIFK